MYRAYQEEKTKDRKKYLEVQKEKTVNQDSTLSRLKEKLRLLDKQKQRQVVTTRFASQEMLNEKLSFQVGMKG